MDSFEANKIFGAVLGAVFVVFGGSLLAEGLFHAESPETAGYAIVAAEPAAAGEGGEAAAAVPVATLLASADAERGAAQFKKCASCHSAEDGGPNKVGPGLWNVVNRPIASHEGFSYSAAMTAFAEGGAVVWDFEHLNGFILNPKGYVSGTAMGFAGLKDDADRADLLAYLRSLSSAPAPLPEAAAAAPAEGEAAPAEAAAAPAEGAAPADAAAAAPDAAAATPAEPAEQTTEAAPAAEAPAAAAPVAPAPAEQQAAAEPSPAPPAQAAPASAPVAPAAAPTAPAPAPATPAAAPAAAPAATAVASSGDPVAGKAAFRKCQACHAVGPNAANKIGPELNGIIGEAPAAVEGYSFSTALKEYAATNPAWDEASMTEWLTNPKALVAGTKMAFPGIKKPDEIANIIAYLKTFDEAGATVAPAN